MEENKEKQVKKFRSYYNNFCYETKNLIPKSKALGHFKETVSKMTDEELIANKSIKATIKLLNKFIWEYNNYFNNCSFFRQKYFGRILEDNWDKRFEKNCSKFVYKDENSLNILSCLMSIYKAIKNETILKPIFISWQDKLNIIKKMRNGYYLISERKNGGIFEYYFKYKGVVAGNESDLIYGEIYTVSGNYHFDNHYVSCLNIKQGIITMELTDESKWLEAKEKYEEMMRNKKK